MRRGPSRSLDSWIAQPQRDVDGIFAEPENYNPNSRWHRIRKAAATTILTAPK